MKRFRNWLDISGHQAKIGDSLDDKVNKNYKSDILIVINILSLLQNQHHQLNQIIFNCIIMDKM